MSTAGNGEKGLQVSRSSSTLSMLLNIHMTCSPWMSKSHTIPSTPQQSQARPWYQRFRYLLLDTYD
jgi:hypothetical protein